MKISLQNCGKNFHRSWLFQHLSFDINFNQINTNESLKLAILGSNGSGKSTLTLLLAGQLDPTEGSIQWFDSDLREIPQHHWFKHVALASPGMELPEEFTLQEWFHFHQRIKGFQTGIKLVNILDICGFPKATANKNILTFSSGMKQRVKLCSALLGYESLVILDEPLTNLDTAGSDIFNGLITEHLKNRALIIASNREEEWKSFCNCSYTIGNNSLSALSLI